MEAPLFDRAAADYDRWYLTDLGRAVDEVEANIVECLFTPINQQILEVGCGTGLYTARLALRGLDVTAVDISGEMMKKAQSRLEQQRLKAHWIQADVTKLLPSLGTFGGIISVTAFEFISEPERVLRELFSHLDPGGCLVVGIIAGGSAWSKLYEQSVLDHPESVFAQAKFYTEEDLRGWQVDGKLDLGKALYFPPSVKTYAEAMEAEKYQDNHPGFIVGKWVRI